jgi:hypothetical protein
MKFCISTNKFELYKTIIIAITVLLFLMLNPVFAVQNTPYGVQNNAESPSSQYDDSATDYPKVTNFENRLYNRSFTGQNIYSRISRIEKTLFTKSFDSEELIDRVDRISDNLENKNDKKPAFDSYDDNISSNLPLGDLNNLEEKTFGHPYQNDNPVVRIKRLENELLGATQSGDMNNRIERLKVASQNQGLSDFSDRDDFSASNPNLDNFENLGGGSGFSSYGGNSSTGILNSLIPALMPYLQNLLNYNSNLNNGNNLDPYLNRQVHSSYGTAAGVHIMP